MKTLIEKKKILVASIFSFSIMFSNLLKKEKEHRFSHSDISVFNAFNLDKALTLLSGKGLIAV